jgi:HK97 gp10 family phage protein
MSRKSMVIGGPRIRRILRAMPQEGRKEIADALDRGIRMVQATAVALAPSDTGNLKRTLAMKGAIGKREGGLRVEFGLRTRRLQKKAYYASFVEFGTKGYRAGSVRVSGRKGKNGRAFFKGVDNDIPARPAQPFLRPAFDANYVAIRRIVNGAVRSAIQKARARG